MFSKTSPPGKKHFSNSAVKSYRAHLNNADFKKWLQVNAPKAQVTGGWDIALNGVSVKLNGTSLEKLRTAPQGRAGRVQRAVLPG